MATISPALRAIYAEAGIEIVNRQGQGGGQPAHRGAVVLESLHEFDLHYMRREGWLVFPRWFKIDVPSDPDNYPDDFDALPPPSVSWFSGSRAAPYITLTDADGKLLRRWDISFRRREHGFGSCIYWECPSPTCHCAVRKFYVDPRRAIIGCRFCLRGVNATTKMKPWERAGWKARTIRIRLLAQEPNDTALPQRPRGMRGRTYDRLGLEHQALMHEFLVGQAEAERAADQRSFSRLAKLRSWG